MNNSKKINVNYSSLVGLKAELLRKHAEVEEAKAKMDFTKTNLPKPKVKTKKIKNKEEKKLNKPEKVTEIEDINLLKKSKYMLEAKARLYDKLKKQGYDGGDNDNDDRYLVDFSNKSDESDSEIYHEEDYNDLASDPEEDWVEYQDCFGRTRKCLRKDLPKMKEKDNLIKDEIVEKPVENENNNKPQYKFIPPEKEPEIEIMRKKWEEQTEKLTHKSDIHYQDILFDEARAHGVGYYAFSQDEDERAKQQANLAKLRKETEQRQKEVQEIKELKSKMEQNRLKAARIRQRIRAGLPPEPTEEEIAKETQSTIAGSTSTEADKTNDIPNNETVLSTTSEPEISKETDNSRDSDQEKNNLKTIEDKIKAFGELLGKRPSWRELSQEEWIEKRRKDRHGEFAPAYDNFKSGGYLKHNRDYQLVAKQLDNEDDPLRLKINGPDPTDLWESTGPDTGDDNDNKTEIKTVDPIIFPDSSNDQDKNSTLSSRISTPPDISAINFSEPPPPIYSVPPSSSNTSTLPHSLWEVHPAVVPNRLSVDSGDDDSEIIGPMPPTSVIDNYAILSQIPLPSDTSAESEEIESKNKRDLDSDKIAQGLKYLREKFDNVNNK
ncbi:coiled-coil domain-containing protein 174 [Microplitis mediator]|uniref:coiled-coil domain-containing protein 174 n=1 Tax=Microplitis mediator TaxID=375433 RepID=UPI0025567773|nr:coiled-coil domain-containing protein 174 [Microplitis mediator]